MIVERRDEVIFGMVTGRFMDDGASLALGLAWILIKSILS